MAAIGDGQHDKHSEMERGLRQRGFELMRVMYQGWLDQRSLEERREELHARWWSRAYRCAIGAGTSSAISGVCA
jgi:hypothetical protein